MSLAIQSLFVVFLLTLSVAYVMMARFYWLEGKEAKRTAQIVEMQYAMTKEKYDAWLESNKKVGGSE